MIGRIMLALAAYAVLSESSRGTAGRTEPVLRLPPPSRWKRLATDRRIKSDNVEHDDYGVTRLATRYSACEWEPLPWTLTVWSDMNEGAEIFVLDPHCDVAKNDLRVSVRWSMYPERSEKAFQYAREIDRDERFHNRLIHRHGKGPGTYLIEIRFQGGKVSFFHHLKEEEVSNDLVPISTTEVALPAVPPNPFDERLARFIRLQEQYEEAKERTYLRKLPTAIERPALDELERVFQDEVDHLEEDKQRAQ